MAWETKSSKNSAHTLAYSLVGLQEMNLAYKYPIIYWNTANLIVDSGGLDGTGTNYGKIAKAIGEIRKAGVKLSLVDINFSDYSFKPDVNNNQIIYGLNAINGIGEKLVQAIIDNRPYTSLNDFIQKIEQFKEASKENKFGNTAIITLIKTGAFDNIEHKERTEIMWDFIKSISNQLNSLSMNNIEELKQMNILTDAHLQYEYRLYNFRKYVLQPKFYSGKQTGKGEATKYYMLEHKFAEPYFLEHFASEMKEGEDKDYEYNEQGFIIVKKGSLDREFKKLTLEFNQQVLSSQENLDKVNIQRAKKLWEEVANGSISKWEMDSLCFYYHDHELAHINYDKYLINDFYQLPEEPMVAEWRHFKNKDYPRFALGNICGTVIDKNKDKGIVTLLTPTGVVQVKFYKGHFNFYNQQISQSNADGTKTVLEKSWFARGNKIMVTGYRKEDFFFPKKYKDSAYKHSLQLIIEIDGENIKTITKRINEEEEDNGFDL